MLPDNMRRMRLATVIAVVLPPRCVLRAAFHSSLPTLGTARKVVRVQKKATDSVVAVSEGRRRFRRTVGLRQVLLAAGSDERPVNLTRGIALSDE